MGSSATPTVTVLKEHVTDLLKDKSGCKANCRIAGELIAYPLFREAFFNCTQDDAPALVAQLDQLGYGFNPTEMNAIAAMLAPAAKQILKNAFENAYEEIVRAVNPDGKKPVCIWPCGG